ncbi:MAG: histidinol dehydrogenase [Candidatus Nanopelagicales bacterium]
MIKTLDFRNKASGESLALPRSASNVDQVINDVKKIVSDVQSAGDAAVLKWNKTFSNIQQSALLVPKEVIDQALVASDPDLIAALKTAIERVRKFHEIQVRTEQKIEVAPEGWVSIDWIPVARVGLYVPGGGAVYPSSVIMNVVPAQIAAVESIVVASPGQTDNQGWPDPTILAACALLGIDEVYAAGGAQAIAMLAYGTDSCQKVNLITGPGNIYVTAAKRLVRSVVGIDSEAGPTEIAILADSTANPSWIAADLVSQAEHDVAAASVLVTDSPELAKQVEYELALQVANTKHSERITKALSGEQSSIVLVSDLEQGLLVINEYAAEHLELHVSNPEKMARRVKNAGAVFIGPFAPVSLGDYLAGSNHVLPTAGCACHSSGLSVQTFLRGVQFINYSKSALEKVRKEIDVLANAEDLPAHAKAVEVRFERD